ncbi:MAG TPA: hypothetical protein PLB36_07590 [Bacillota bacterium]|nr:hypothetical protein [Bacillota bacterium]HOK65146.1 hypothetical protein [Bacillota bacterium]HOL12712.1 hypothetical protein [Bacillota bacterium]HOQ02666.1 hypothetical protein [Bacillota bacterium]HPP61590.1 hypothetical protein [Bacillota bacterium]
MLTFVSAVAAVTIVGGLVVVATKGCPIEADAVVHSVGIVGAKIAYILSVVVIGIFESNVSKGRAG